MQISWPSRDDEGIGPDTSGGVLHVAVRLWRDLPTMSRLSGHLLVIGLLLILAWNYVPRQPGAPRITSWRAASSLTISGSQTTGASVEPNTRFLEPGAVPLTMRISGEVMPVVEPQRQVRTSTIVYTVQPGDTVLGIAEMFGLRGTSLLWANRSLAENPDFLQIGQKLNILPVDGVYHQVVKGETLESIAKRYKVTPETISGYRGNGMPESATLQAGQWLIVPGGIMPVTPKPVTVYSGQVPSTAKKGSGKFVWPVSGTITQRYWEGHQAVDIAGSKGTTVVAADSGYVASVQYSSTGYGRMVIIDHGNGYQTLYAHLNTIAVSAGQSVARGEAIGTRGSTGNSTGPHLHFEVRKNGVRVNPLNHLP